MSHSQHPWAKFLRARKLVIDYLIYEGSTFEQIAVVLSMDAKQVKLISMAPKTE